MNQSQRLRRSPFASKANWRTHLLEAKALLEAGRYNNAKARIQEALSLAPQKARALRTAHAIYRQSGDLGPSADVALRLVKRHPRKAENYILAAQALVQAGRRKKAQKWLTKGLRRFPEHLTLLNMRSELQLITGEPLAFAMPKTISLPGELPTQDRIQPHQKDRAKPALVERQLNTIDTDNDQGETRLYHCENALITRFYGVHDRSGNPFFGTFLTRQKFSPDGRTWAKYPLGYPFKITTPRSEELITLPSAFYITNALCDHFGHLLTEALSSIHPLLQWKEAGLSTHEIPIILPLNQDKQQGLRFNRLLRAIGLTNSDFLIPGKHGRNLLVRDLYVAKPTIILGGQASKAHPSIVRQYLRNRLEHEPASEQKSDMPDKVFISRSKLSGDSRAIPEMGELERLLEESGWLIFHPQLHSMRQQITIYENAKFLCSVPGSALHLLYGLELKNLRRLILLAYQSETCNNLINYRAQLEAQAIPYSILKCLSNEDTNSGIGEYFTNQKQRELRLEFMPELELRDLAQEISDWCQ